jgi:hypothetical protein
MALSTFTFPLFTAEHSLYASRSWSAIRFRKPSEASWKRFLVIVIAVVSNRILYTTFHRPATEFSFVSAWLRL